MLFGVFCLPTLTWSAYLLVCWFRIHTSDVFYAEYRYGTAALIFLGTGLLSLWATWYGAWRRSFYGLLFVVPTFLGLATMVEIPCVPPNSSSLAADADYLSAVRASFRLWYGENHRYPANESEFTEALAKGSTAGLYRGRVPASAYRQRGLPLPYEIVVEPDASGPRLSNFSRRPGVIYYRVSKDLQEFWLTMTQLPAELAFSATVARMETSRHIYIDGL
jgi:hypothetical protein